ncbi:MAG: DUF4255 domain-containing protein [Chloroflexi bacterium]|nr:DUF4255 domain-containing protein [Chloroflexota bacterium]
MINDLDETIRQLLIEQAGFAPNSVAISFDQPTSDWSARLNRPVINCYLYDIRENLELRSHELRTIRNSNGTASQQLAPLRYNLSYLITVWTQQQVEDEHAILWRVLGVLANNPVLAGSYVQGALRDQPLPIAASTAQPSSAIQNLPDLWGVMQNQLRPSINYTVTLAMDRPYIASAPLVLSRELRMSGAPDETTWEIAGIVHTGGKEPRPLAGVTVAINELGVQVVSDALGRYRFSGLAQGTVEVVAMMGKASVRKRVAVPLEKADPAGYDLILSI